VTTGVAVVGAGSWGTTMASLLSRNARTALWARRSELAAEITAMRRNPAYLPDVELPTSLFATSSLAEVMEGAEVVVMAVPSHGFREIFESVACLLGDGVPVVSLTKGLESGTLMRMTEVVGEIAPASPAGVLTGPNLASEVIAGQPTASVLAMRDEALAWSLQELFSTEMFRVYTNTDVVGCEIAGALKNVIAIAAGIAAGLGFGDNTRAALVTRGLAELGRLGVAIGADSLTFGGLAGMGDLVATCTSPRSRNRHVGEQLGLGRSLEDIVSETRMVAEGVKTAAVAVELAERNGVELPIADQVVAVLSGAKRPAEVIPALMRRRPRPELDWRTAERGRAAGSGARVRTVPAEGGEGAPPPPPAAASPHEAAMESLKAFLRSRGVDAGEIEKAIADDSLDLLAVDTALVPRRPGLTAEQVSERSGLPLATVHQAWTAMGFPDVADDDPVFSEVDVEGLSVMQQLLVHVTADTDTAVQLLRVMGSAMARVAEAEVAASSELMGVTDRAQVAEVFVVGAEPTIAAIGRLLEYVWRRHLEAATHRLILREEGATLSGASAELAVGFADLVGYTMLSQELDESELAEVATGFEEVAHESVTSRGGRLVKMIGDEAMFVVEDPRDAAMIALELSEAYAGADVPSSIRVGLAFGSVVARDGDYYGPVVNLASRVVNMARAGSVLVSDAMHSELRDEEGLEWRPLRPRQLRHIGRVQLWVLRRAPRAGRASARSGARATPRREGGAVRRSRGRRRETS
jgi:glycerol-3-phosphate dehydrogenase (NAD(P)+)